MSEQPRYDEIDDLLVGYGAGLLSSSASFLVACHLEIDNRNRDFVSGLENLGGQMLLSEDSSPISDRDGRLDAIYRSKTDEDESQSPRLPGDSVLPTPLRQVLGRDVEHIRWKSVLPGLKECEISIEDGAEVSLLWIMAGQAMPTHTHGGSELTLVLKGGFQDATGHYVRGDIAIADDDLDHRPVADADEDCMCLVVLDAPVQLTGPIGRLIEPFRPKKGR